MSALRNISHLQQVLCVATNMSEVMSFKDSLPRFVLNHPKSATGKFVKDTYLPISNTSPVHRPNAKLPKTLTGKRVKYLSCPVQSTPKRFWYECPKCHRFRNFMDDRDQFILYGVTRLWPTPPPAPPTFSSPQVGDSSSVDCMEGTYNICRIFHASSAKLHPRNSHRRHNVIIPTTGFLRKSPTSNKMRQKQLINQVIIPSNGQSSSNTNNTRSDLANMVDLLRRYVSPHKHFVIQRSVSSSTNVTKTVSEKMTISKTENTTKVMPPAQKSVGSSRPQSPKIQRSIVRSLTQCKSVNMTASHSTCFSRSNLCQSISQSQLEQWTKRLRNGALVQTNGSFFSENDKTQLKHKSGNPSGRRKRRLRRKSKSMKRKGSIAKSTDASRTNSVASPRLDVTETLSGKESVVSKAGKTLPSAGSLWSLGGESMMSAIMSSSRTESIKKRHRIRTKKRARNFSARTSSASRETQEGMTINTQVTTHIEAVKIGEDKATTPNRRSSRRRKMMKKSTGSVNLIEKNRTSEANSMSAEEKTSSAVSSGSPYSPRNPNDPVALLEDFRNRMKKCQGKGFIKASHIEVIAYLEGKKSDTKPQATPKTYQQMGLAPLKRSESSENSTQFLNFKCALSDTEIMPKLALSGHGRRKKKKKKRKSKSTPSSPKRKSDGGDPLREAEESKGANKQAEKSASLGKQKSNRHRGHRHNATTTTSTALSATALSTN